MASRIEDYALIGNCASAALVSKTGSIDWMALPRFDDAAFFAALLGKEENGFWRIAPVAPPTRVTRRYLDGTMVLETRFETEEGVAVLTDCLTRRDAHADLVRLVRCERGQVAMRMDLVIRFDYGAVVPWVTRTDDGRITAVAGPDRLTFATLMEVRNENMRSVAAFTLAAGQSIDISMNWAPSYAAVPPAVNPAEVAASAAAMWRQWSGKLRVEDDPPRRDLVLRSVLTLKALTHFETGGIVAAPTTSLPEALGGARNWDYRFCWLRDATLTLYALMNTGFIEEAGLWRNWLLRAIAGMPEQMQIMYGVAGERRLDEYELPWLEGYESSKPVRIGNAASNQLQLDVFGEIADALFQARRLGLPHDPTAWALMRAILTHLSTIWRRPDAGIWEIRGPARHFTHSKVMVWVAFDRAVRAIEELGLEGPLDEWKAIRDEVHAQVCTEGYNAERGHFTQYFGGTELDASLLLIATVGFLPAEDPRVAGTVKAIEDNLLRDGFVLRYRTESQVDGLSGHEGAFLPCSFWLVDNYVLTGRLDEANALFDRLAALSNDVGLLSEEYDVGARRQVGNFPQAFTHVALINAAVSLSAARMGAAQHRSSGTQATGGDEAR